jgi:hypothetical protein
LAAELAHFAVAGRVEGVTAAVRGAVVAATAVEAHFSKRSLADRLDVQMAAGRRSRNGFVVGALVVRHGDFVGPQGEPSTPKARG